MPYTDIMIDCETLGTKRGSMIRTIALVAFNRHDSSLGHELSLRLDIIAQGKLGMLVDPGTFLWWLGQSDQARAAMTSREEVISPEEAVTNIRAFVIQHLSTQGVVWAKSPRFDCSLIEDLCERLNTKLPWHFAAEDDVRTIMRLAGDTSRPPSGAHDALADARHQASVVQKSWAMLGAVRLDDLS